MNDSMVEEWKDIEGFENYQVSNRGRVRSCARLSYGDYITKRSVRERILKSHPDGKGYLMVWLYKDAKRHTMKVHRLVAKAFIPNEQSKPQIDHINGDKKDNRANNLRWCTEKENFNNPISYKRNSESKLGAKNHHARAVIQFSFDMSVIRKWECINDACRHLGATHSHIVQCCKGYRKSSCGYKWKYADEL